MEKNRNTPFDLIWGGVKKAKDIASDTRKLLLPTREERLVNMQNTARQTFLPEIAAKKIYEEDLKYGSIGY